MTVKEKVLEETQERIYTYERLHANIEESLELLRKSADLMSKNIAGEMLEEQEILRLVEQLLNKEHEFNLLLKDLD